MPTSLVSGVSGRNHKHSNRNGSLLELQAPPVEARIMTKNSETEQLGKFFNHMQMLTKTTFEIVS